MDKETQVPVPPTVSSYVLTAIRDAILDGRYPPGSKLDQRQLASSLNVSLIPLRESLRQLGAEGFVRIYPHRGAFVANVSHDELDEIYLIRQTLEELITRLAIPNLSSKTLEQLGILIRDMSRATAARDSEKLLELNRSFHFSIYQESNRPLLLQMITSLWDRSIRYRRLYQNLPGRAQQALAEHKQIFAACKAGDPISAGKAVRNNVHQTAVGILTQVQKNS
jgi:DNA-binding GntR family transcriptional regulator